MLYVFRRAVSESARELAESMSINCRKVGNLHQVHYGHGLRTGDAVICWGESLRNAPAGVRVLNGVPLRSKFEDAQVLRAARVSTVEVSATQPPNRPAQDDVVNVNAGRFNRAQARELLDTINRYLATPPRPAETWLPRRNAHMGGHDLLTPPRNPDFWSKKEAFTREFRVHMFKGRSIRAGLKGPREGATQHPWIRSFDAGWAINYNGFSSTKPMRVLAAATCEALELDFAAIDIGEKADGTLVVLEANRCPGLEGGTTEAYANAIQRWMVGGENDREEGR